MKMFISNEDLLLVIREAIRQTATRLNINHVDLKSTKELYDELMETKSTLITPLNKFCDSYTSWYKFHLDRESKNEYTDSEKDKLRILIQNRDTSRKELIDALSGRGANA